MSVESYFVLYLIIGILLTIPFIEIIQDNSKKWYWGTVILLLFIVFMPLVFVIITIRSLFNWTIES